MSHPLAPAAGRAQQRQRLKTYPAGLHEVEELKELQIERLTEAVRQHLPVTVLCAGRTRLDQRCPVLNAQHLSFFKGFLQELIGDHSELLGLDVESAELHALHCQTLGRLGSCGLREAMQALERWVANVDMASFVAVRLKLRTHTEQGSFTNSVLWLDLGVDELLQGSALRKLEDFLKSGDVSSPQPLLEVLLPVLQGQHVMQLVICGPPEDPATGASKALVKLLTEAHDASRCLELASISELLHPACLDRSCCYLQELLTGQVQVKDFGFPNVLPRLQQRYKVTNQDRVKLHLAAEKALEVFEVGERVGSKPAMNLEALQKWQEELQSCVKRRLSELQKGMSEVLDVAEPPSSTPNFYLSPERVPKAQPRVEKTAEAEKGVNMLDEWSETFVMVEEDAVAQYNEMYELARKHGKNPSRGAAARRLMPDLRTPHLAQKLLTSFPAAWEIVVVVIVMVDLWSIPLGVAWPSYIRGSLYVYTQGRFVLWIIDILVALVPGLVELKEDHSLHLLKRYICLRMPVDVALVYVDILSAGETLQGPWRLIRLLLLGRLWKVTRGLFSIENYFAARAHIKVVHYLTIVQCVVRILAVTHILACLLFWVGNYGLELGLVNWIDRYQIVDYDMEFQYLISFNWVIAQYTPAPFPQQAQNYWEECAVILIILTCLPLLGSEIAKVSGTVNLLTEKSRERDKLRRDLQRWLRMTHAPERLVATMLDSLQDVLRSKDSPLEVKEPMALKFLPSTLLEELRIVKMTEKLAGHPMFSLLMDQGLGIAGALSSSFGVTHVVQGESAFEAGRKAEALFITQSGEFFLHLPRKTGVRGSTKAAMTSLLDRATVSSGNSDKALATMGDMALARSQWLAEACLYAGLQHTCSVTATSYSKLLRCPVVSFVREIQKSPAAVVAIHEYATRLVSWVGEHTDEIWEILDGKLITEGVQRTQLSDLLVPGFGKIHSYKSDLQTDFSTLYGELKAQKSNQELLGSMREHVPELQEDGLYNKLGIQDDAQRALLSMLSAVWFLKGDYSSMVACQKPQACLRERTFHEIKSLLNAEHMTSNQLTAAQIVLAIRGLAKTNDLARLCPPSERRSPEQVLLYAVNHLDTYLPSIASIMGDLYDLTLSTIRMLGQYNFAQFLQGENNPYAISLLQSSLKLEGLETYQVFLLVQVCILCGVTGAARMDGSLFLTELNGRSVLKGLAALQDVAQKDPRSIYWNFIARRAEALHLPVEKASHFVLARLACLTRTTDTKGLQNITNSWDQLTEVEQERLHEIFLLDGLQNKTVMFLYLPLFLTNAVAKQDLGLCSGLQVLVELYIKLLKHRCLHRPQTTVKIDISSIAAVAKEVDELRLLRQCLEHCRIMKHMHGITVLLTAKCYQILSGQVVAENRQSDLIETLVAQHRKLHESFYPPARSELVMSEDIAAHEF